MVLRIFALGFIFVCSWVAWGVLSFVMDERTDDKSYAMADAVGALWGTEHTQTAPHVGLAWTTVRREQLSDEEKRRYIENKQKEANLEALRLGIRPQKVFIDPEEFWRTIQEEHSQEATLDRSAIEVGLDLEYRQKGLLWFSLYTVRFDATYTFENPVDQAVAAHFVLPLPSARAVYDNMRVVLEGRDDVAVTPANGSVTAAFVMAPRSRQTITVGYVSRGLDQWTYRFGEQVGLVRNFDLRLRTNFDEIDFPRESISPDTRARRTEGTGWEMGWHKQSLLSGIAIGILMPHRINPGPLAASMSVHAPVSLFFFFFVLFILQAVRGIRIHPMNYFFLAASFFAFNVLFSYLVDHLDVVLAFVVASIVSLGLVASYLRLVVSWRFALVEAGLSQILFQVLFGVAHFFEGYTGLTITLGAIITLAVVMRLTAHVDWEAQFATRRPSPPSAPPSAPLSAPLPPVKAPC